MYLLPSSSTAWFILPWVESMVVAFIAFRLFLATVGFILGVDEQMLHDGVSILMLVFGLVIVVQRFQLAYSSHRTIPSRRDARPDSHASRPCKGCS